MPFSNQIGVAEVKLCRDDIIIMLGSKVLNADLVQALEDLDLHKNMPDGWFLNDARHSYEDTVTAWIPVEAHLGPTYTELHLGAPSIDSLLYAIRQRLDYNAAEMKLKQSPIEDTPQP